MRRFFARNLLFVVGINLLVKPLWIFLIDRTVQNRVGEASYGTYLALWNLTMIFQIILDFGLNAYNTRIISRDPDRFSTIFPVLFTARLLLVAVFAATVLAAAWVMGYRRYELALLAGIMAFQSLAIMLLFIRSNVAGLQRFKLDGVLSVTDRLLMILVCGTLLFLPATAGRFTIEWFILTQIGCYLLAGIIGLFLLRRIVRMPRIISFDFREVRTLIKEGAPYALLTFLMAIYMRSDAILVERLCSNVQNGIYGKSIRILDVVNQISIMIAAVLMPLFGRMLAQKQDVTPIIRLCTNLMLPASFLLTVVGWVAGSDVMQLLYHQSGPYHGRVFAWLMVAAPAYSIMYIYSTLLTANGDIRLLNKLAIAGAVLNLSLNFMVIPHLQAMGAAITAAITQWVLAACFIYFAARKNNLPFHPRWVGAHAAYVLVLAAAGYILSRSSLFWPERLGVLTACAALLVLLFRFIDLKALKTMLLNR